jgi:hypothetical protein
MQYNECANLSADMVINFDAINKGKRKMIDGMMKSVLAVMGITPEDARNMANNTVNTIRSIDDRLERIERALNITDNGRENNADNTSGTQGRDAGRT